MTHASTAEVLRTTDELTFQWLRLKKIVYRDAHDKERTWELAQRTTRRGKVDGVGIVARLSIKSFCVRRYATIDDSREPQI